MNEHLTTQGGYMRRLSGAWNSYIFPCVLIISLLLTGCATPVGVKHLDPKQVQRNLTTNILSSDELSASTQQILNRANLTDKFKSHPATVLADLHKGLPTATETDRLFALAELSYTYASEKGPREYFFASAIYAYAFLFPTVGRTDNERYGLLPGSPGLCILPLHTPLRLAIVITWWRANISFPNSHINLVLLLTITDLIVLKRIN